MANEKSSSIPRTCLPRHVAVIMDGNGRWAKQRHLPRFAGHRAGLESVRSMVKLCLYHGIEALTLFAFSSENWRRPKDEVGLLMNLFMTALDNEVDKLHKNGIRLRILGDTNAFPPELQRRISNAEALTGKNNALTLAVAVNYGGRWDITQAARSIAEAVAAGEIRPEDITPEVLGARLALSELSEPDLFIRTGGEQRISNFLLWQLAYTELYFTTLLWPEFREAGFEAALDSFMSRQRRFGKTGDQVEQERA